MINDNSGGNRDNVSCAILYKKGFINNETASNAIIIPPRYPIRDIISDSENTI